jgi:hypothetical protein
MYPTRSYSGKFPDLLHFSEQYEIGISFPYVSEYEDCSFMEYDAMIEKSSGYREEGGRKFLLTICSYVSIYMEFFFPVKEPTLHTEAALMLRRRQKFYPAGNRTRTVHAVAIPTELSRLPVKY